MIVDISPSVNAIISQWEEAGASLFVALRKYLDSSYSLEKEMLSQSKLPKDLIVRIDTALYSLDHQTATVRSTFTRMRNRTVSPIFRLPHEILSDIFMRVIFSTLDPTEFELIETSVTKMYLELYNLLGVCKAWRDVLLERGEFWSIIPIVNFSPPMREVQPKRMNLDYFLSGSAGGPKGDLHLLATQPYDPSYDSILPALAPRFRTVNIITKRRSTIKSIIDVFLNPRLPEPLALSQLSVYQDQGYSYYHVHPGEKNYVFLPGSSKQELFKELTRKLSVLRVRGAQFHWDRFSFSHRLTEVYLQDVLLGYDIAAIGFINALSSASELRVLTLVSVRSFFGGLFCYDSPTRLQIDFPNLETVFLDDLYFNTLDCFLSSISSRSYRLDIHLSMVHRFLYLLNEDTLNEDSMVSFKVLYELLRDMPIRKLLISEGEHGQPSPWELKELMASVTRNMELLWVQGWQFDTDYCRVLSYHSIYPDSSNSAPALTSLRITCAQFRDQGAFINMLTSYSGKVPEMIVGAAFFDDTSFDRVPVEKLVLERALKDSIPCIRLVDSDFTPPEFEGPLWRLW
ncbi:unnamed protein product [Rhizoctonia solani]|uniref:F-box domain-containing protein n=1 Tax=Rhizoctonia solani TaxID=456999 RepID=A0A8H3A8P3_9AGAM|nr:unnamed protein product [Rhizoctonia solani]